MKNKNHTQNSLRLFLSAIFPLFAATGCITPSSSVLFPASLSPDRSVIRVNVTRQGYSFHRPWQPARPSSATAIGVVISGRRVLVTSKLVADHRYIELEKTDSGEKSTAMVEAVDYEANLALLLPKDPRFLEGMRPLELTVGAKSGDSLAVWQVQRNGNIVLSKGPITSIEVSRYAYGHSFLTYRLNSSLQYRLGNMTLPVVKNGKLAGLLKSYNSKAQTVDVIAAPVIDHFLKDTSDGVYQGFPLSGFRVVPTEDPQLRRYVGISEKSGGVYVQNVSKGSPAEKGGLREGDIIMEIADFTIDARGNYDHPRYGKTSIVHLLRCHFHAGDTVPLKVFRAGRTMMLHIIPRHRSATSYLVPPYIIDKPPRYYILGGLILQELSMTYLREYGANWSLNAPTHLVYYAKNQNYLDSQAGEKIVILSRVMPTSYTIGYEGLSDLVITRINHKTIHGLEDVLEALESPLNGFHKIEFEHAPKVIYLDPSEIPRIEDQLRRRYNIPSLKNLE